MDIERLDCELEYANHSGSTLNIEELTHLQLSVLKLNENEKFDKVNFWGRIKGLANDYYIIVGIRFKERVNFPERQYYWCNDDFFLSPLIKSHPDNDDFLHQFNGYFSGQHDKILRATGFDVPTSEVTVVNGKISTIMTDDAIIKKGNHPKPITELDRLAFTVRAIEHECAVVPNAAYRCTPNDEVRVNNYFKGLTIAEASDLKNFLHFRPSSQQTKIDMLSKKDRTDILNFFDGLTSDVSNGAWSLTQSADGLCSYVRHAKWPGFVSYHRANSNIFGYVYFGEGRRLNDIHFLV